jgi:MFS family permease
MSTQLHLSLRGGAAADAVANSLSFNPASVLSTLTSTPQALFNSALVGLGLLVVLLKLAGRETSDSIQVKPAHVQSLQARFLSVFWLLRMSDWMQGPYFYEVYASKIFQGVPASMTLVSRLFLTGFASTALFGPSVGRAADTYGTKRATIAFCVLYALGALSTKSPILQILFVGRILSGIGTSLLFSAPEAWLVSEAQKTNSTSYLGDTFGLAYAGDSVVAILAGQLAMGAAVRRGPSGPFELSTVFLALGGILCTFLWKENKAPSVANSKPSIREAVQVIQKDPKIALVGGVQSLFEAAMYIFVLQWPPAFRAAVESAFAGGVNTAATPYGTIFSCFMASCLLGSTIFGQFAKLGVATEKFTSLMLVAATVAMTAATVTVKTTGSLWGLVASFFVFEACVGMYFPSIGTLRSKYIPDSHRSVIMNLFGIPLNVLVVGVFLSIDKLGLGGALTISSGALAVASLCMLKLRGMTSKGQV